MKLLGREEFRLPFGVLALLTVGFVPGLGALWIAAIVVGLCKIGWNSIEKIREGAYSLDYIAFLAMVVSLPSAEYLAGAVVALMIIGGEALDQYASRRAESVLRALAERIPKTCIVRLPNASTVEKIIQDVQIGDIIVVRPNELVPLDGTLRSSEALLNEANLTGEALPVSFVKGTFIKSGVINVGPTLEMAVESSFENSTYMKIVNLVSEAKQHQPRMVRLAEKVNFPFTTIALLLAGGAWLATGELARALAVLVIATPCPLLIAAPVAFIGGLSRAARKNVIVKRPAILEEIARARAIYFDKTGTLTLGEPALTKIEPLAHMSEEDILAIASAIEFHSIHPLARAVQSARAQRSAPALESTQVVETIGKGIEGIVQGTRYRIMKSPVAESGIVLSLYEGTRELGRLHFEDVMKPGVAEILSALKRRGFDIEMLTGDRRQNAERLFGGLGITIRSELTPESKFAIIDEARAQGRSVIMVGDGLNDAPALAHANVGVVFSGTENSAAIEAAGVAILSSDVSLVRHLIDTAERSTRIARQSIWGGIALSVVGMGLAAFGFIPPVEGAIIQEVIDIVVILNSVRAAAD